jgi:hypothetical protein
MLMLKPRGLKMNNKITQLCEAFPKEVIAFLNQIILVNEHINMEDMMDELDELDEEIFTFNKAKIAINPDFIVAMMEFVLKLNSDMKAIMASENLLRLNDSQYLALKMVGPSFEDDISVDTINLHVVKKMPVMRNGMDFLLLEKEEEDKPALLIYWMTLRNSSKTPYFQFVD